MELNKLLDKIKKYIYDEYSKYTEKGGGYNYRYFHAIRACDMVSIYIKTTDIKLDTKPLIVACLLHDIGKLEFVKESEINLDLDEKLHSVEGAKKSKKVLEKLGVIDTRLTEKVSNIILHHHDKIKRSKEIEILQNADNLDEFGYLNIWRMFGYSFQHRKSPFECYDYWKKEYSKLINNINTRFSIPFFKKVALRRLKRCNEFMKKFKEELKSKD